MNAKVTDIEKALSRLNHEVSDLHPRLQELFGKLANVTDVEYTHGPNEMGADFILTEKNNMGGTDYVGVIVKNKNLTQSGINDVDRQIGECGTPRCIGNGKQRVHMNKVLVIVNGTISRNAKDKIHAAHKIGVTFVSRKGLANLMSAHDYNPTSDLPTNIAICLSKQVDLAENLKKQSIGLGVSDTDNVFMKQRIIKHDPHQYTHGKSPRRAKKPQKYQVVSIDTAIKDNNTFLLYGEPGCGKSKMLQNVLSNYASVDSFKSTKMIPIYVTCKDVIEKYGGEIQKLVDCFEKKHGLKESDTEIFYILIIDGIDESGLSRHDRIDQIAKWKKESAPGKVKKMIFSSREYIEQRNLSLPMYRVADLSSREVVNAIKTHLSHLDTVGRIVTDIQRSDIFRSLPQTPLAIVILINLLKNESMQQELPSTLTELFSKYTECSLGRWDSDVADGMKQRKYEATDKILTRIAVYMLDNGVTQLNQGETIDFFHGYLNERNLGIDAESLFERVTLNSNLVYLHDGVFRFRHRTIAEFFYSKHFSDSRIDDIGETIFDVQWSTILFFYVGLQKDCTRLLEKISNINPQQENCRILKAFNMANILLAAYATPYDVIEKVLESTFINLSRYLEDIFGGEIAESGLVKHSVMRVLLFFRIAMDYYFSRPFFKEAIANSMIRIEELEIDDNVKSNSLFLLNMAHETQGGGNIFESMVEKLGNRIPAHIQLAIRHETDFMEKIGKDVQKFKRTIKKNLLIARRRENVSHLYDREIRYLPTRPE